MLIQNVKLSFMLFPLSSLLVNNVLDLVPLQVFMVVNALKSNRLVPLPEVDRIIVQWKSKALNV